MNCSAWRSEVVTRERKFETRTVDVPIGPTDRLNELPAQPPKKRNKHTQGTILAVVRELRPTECEP